MIKRDLNHKIQLIENSKAGASMDNKTFVWTFLGLLILSAFGYIFMSDGMEDMHMSETVREIGQDSVKEVKSGMRKIQDPTCELVDGKIGCAVDEAVDNTKDVADDMNQRFY